MGMLAVTHTANNQIFILRCHPSQTEPISQALLFYLSGEKLLCFWSDFFLCSEIFENQFKKPGLLLVHWKSPRREQELLSQEPHRQIPQAGTTGVSPEPRAPFLLALSVRTGKNLSSRVLFSSGRKRKRAVPAASSTLTEWTHPCAEAWVRACRGRSPGTSGSPDPWAQSEDTDGVFP